MKADSGVLTFSCQLCGATLTVLASFTLEADGAVTFVPVDMTAATKHVAWHASR